MAALSRAALKLFFETGDLPTEAQFADLIDSFPNIADDMGGDPANVRNFLRLFSSAEILALQTTPINIKAAPGVGFAWQLTGGSVYFIWNSIVYLTNFIIRIGSDKASTVNMQGSVQILDGTVNHGKILPVNFVSALNTDMVQENQPLFVYTNANPTAGNSTIIVNAQYKLITIT